MDGVVAGGGGSPAPGIDAGLTVAGLFAGIGGIEQGLRLAGHQCEFLCEVDGAARAVLRERFDGVALADDVRRVRSLPRVDVVAAGFPCQDLSPVGLTAGVEGERFRLVEHVFRLVRRRRGAPRWLLLENVPFMLHLGRGAAMRFLTERLEALGYAWAYRTVDTRGFGLPQRRQRVFLLASRIEDPRSVLLADDAGWPTVGGQAWPAVAGDPPACGFYWTEGRRGLGWTVDAVPTLKAGSTVGIPSPPAIWTRADPTVVTPDIRDLERLQGFAVDWTMPAATAVPGRNTARERLVGNAVSVPVAAWVGRRLGAPGAYDGSHDEIVPRGAPWPPAGWGKDGVVRRADVSDRPEEHPAQHLADFLTHPRTPLSRRATAGFLRRARSSGLQFAPGFLEDVAAHLAACEPRPGPLAPSPPMRA